MSNTLTNCEITVLLEMLEELEEIQGNAGCNDLCWKKTKEHLAFVELFNAQEEDEEMHLSVGHKNIDGCDINVTEYFINKFKTMVD